MANDTYLTENEFCYRYDVASRTLQRWRATGEGPPYVRLGARRVGYLRTDIEAWMRGRTFASRMAERDFSREGSTLI
jgi:predicted DNA-binding transcriptional regulator AlpA